MNLRVRTAATFTSLLLAGVLTGCSGGSGDGPASKTGDSGATVSHVHGLGINPADDRLYVATHEGIVAVGKDGTARRVSDKADYMGFTVVKADTFLGSGHPAPGSDQPANRGLIRSTDGGQTWTTRSLGGEVDFHALEYAHGIVYGYDSTNGLLRVSKDGETWDERARLAALDLAVSPESPKVVLASTENGVARSTDAGETFDEGAQPLLAFLSWPEPDALYGVSPTGELHRSEDGGDTWKKVSTVPGGGPQALTAVSAKHILVATQTGVYESRDGGETFTERLSASGAGGH